MYINTGAAEWVVQVLVEYAAGRWNREVIRDGQREFDIQWFIWANNICLYRQKLCENWDCWVMFACISEDGSLCIWSTYNTRDQKGI